MNGARELTTKEKLGEILGKYKKAAIGVMGEYQKQGRSGQEIGQVEHALNLFGRAKEALEKGEDLKAQRHLGTALGVMLYSLFKSTSHRTAVHSFLKVDDEFMKLIIY